MSQHYRIDKCRDRKKLTKTKSSFIQKHKHFKRKTQHIVLKYVLFLWKHHIALFHRFPSYCNSYFLSINCTAIFQSLSWHDILKFKMVSFYPENICFSFDHTEYVLEVGVQRCGNGICSRFICNNSLEFWNAKSSFMLYRWHLTVRFISSAMKWV